MALAGAAHAQAMGDIRLSGVKLSVTSGTLELQHVVAAEATLGRDGTHILVKDLEVTSEEPGRAPIVATAGEGVIMIAGPRPTRANREHVPGLQEIRDYGRRFIQTAANGDIMLVGSGAPARGTMGDQGSIEAGRIIWSEKYDRVLIPEPFRQRGRGPEGNTVEITGAGLSVDRGFSRFTNFSDPTTQVSMLFGGATAPDKDQVK